MGQVEIEISAREGVGTRASRALRRQGMLPTVVYNPRGENISAKLNCNEFMKLATQVRTSQLFLLKSNDQKLKGRMAIVKEVQKDNLTGLPLHVDLYAFDDSDQVSIDVPIEVKGEAPGVKNEGGVLIIFCRSVMLRGRPRDLPEVVVVDVSELNSGKRIRTGEMSLPKGVVLRSNPIETVVTVISSKQLQAELEAALVSEAQQGALAAGAVPGVAVAEGAEVAKEGTAEAPKPEAGAAAAKPAKAAK